MISFPEGFSLSQLFSDLFGIAAPFAAIGCLIGCGYIILNLLKKAQK